MTYVMSDIHGNKENFENILNQIQLSPDDQLYVLGDVIDRHPFGIELLQRIMKMPNAHMLLGNHEYMMMDALNFPYEEDGTTKDWSKADLLQNWYYNGGRVTHNAWKKLKKEEREEIKDYLKGLPLSIDLVINDHKIRLVHATDVEIYDLCKDIVKESRAFFSVWDRDTIQLLAGDGDILTIFGHTATAHFQNCNPLQVYQNGNILGIDCGCGWPKRDEHGNIYGGRLACVRLEDMHVFYSDEEGGVELDEPEEATKIYQIKR